MEPTILVNGKGDILLETSEIATGVTVLTNGYNGKQDNKNVNCFTVNNSHSFNRKQENVSLECLPINDKVRNWLHTSFAYDEDQIEISRNLRSKATPKVPFLDLRRLPQTLNRIAPPHDEDDSSVDTTKYIKSNRTITRTKISTMSIKHYCILSSTRHTNSPANMTEPLKKRKSTDFKRNGTTTFSMTKRKRKVKYKLVKKKFTQEHGSSSSSDGTIIENRFSRRIAKKQEVQSNNNNGKVNVGLSKQLQGNAPV